jgi:pyrroline-5-carboxylate reductase
MRPVETFRENPVRRATCRLLQRNAMSVPTIGFLGAGKMATALAHGFINARLATPERLIASDLVKPARDAFARETGARTVTENAEVVAAADVLFIAVKPDQVAALLQSIAPKLDLARHLLVSIAAGVTLAKLEAAAPGNRFIRVMPNTPALVGASASAYALGSLATSADADLTDVRFGEILFRQVGLSASRASATSPWALGFRAHTPASFATGSAQSLTDGSRRIRLEHALLSGAEVAANPAVTPVLLAAGIDLRGDLLLRDGVIDLAPDGSLVGMRGEAGLSGFRGLGLSAEAISPVRDLPLRTHFDFAPGRGEQPLRLRDLRLASVVGEADCAVIEGGPFRLSLHGDLAPASLDRVLGNWWIDLWRIFLTQENPYAFIEVQGHWGALTSRTRGRVLMRRFDFMGAPFRRVEVSVDADERRTLIGLHGLQGGTSADDGSVDGTAIWDWSKPGVLAGPTVKAAGDLQPWIAARCAGKNFGDALQGLVLPRGRRFALELVPLEKGLDIRTTIETDGAFTAWGIAGRGLKVGTLSKSGGMLVDARLGLADGEAELHLDGDPLRQTDFVLTLKNCDPAQVGRIMNDLGEPSAAPPTKSAGRGRLDLDFKGRIDLGSPRDLRGLGTYTLNDPELKKVRLLGGISGVLEAVGVGATTYELDRATGTFGCTGGRAYFPDVTITGPQAKLELAGEIELKGMTLNFAGDFSLPRKQGFNPLDIINLNRALVGLTRIKLQGPLAKPETRAIPTLQDIVKPNRDKDLGKIPAGILE